MKHVVLLVEDDPDLRKLLAQALPFFGSFAVVTAVDGVDGLQVFERVHPDCVVMDVKMPGLNGMQLARALRGDPASAAIPLIIVTALAQEHEVFAGMATGTDRYLIKPIKPQALAAAIEQVLRLTEAEREQRYRWLAEEDDDATPRS